MTKQLNVLYDVESLTSTKHLQAAQPDYREQLYLKKKSQELAKSFPHTY
jgi:hypothetical protein